jgi:predicted  nucleic acid-binding Zn-ribbon protein
MKMAMNTLFLFALIAGASAGSTQTNPIQKVIELITNLEAKIMKEGEAEEKAYKEFFEWCDDVAKNKAFEVKTATSAKAKLEATIDKAKADQEDAADVIAKMVADIAQDESDLKDATLIREKEHADFAAAEAELMEGIDMLERAIGIIERNMKGSALLQQPIDTHNLESLLKGVSVVIDAAAFSGDDKKKLLGLIQNMQGDDDADLGAPAPDTYKSHSGGIVDTLTSMKDDAEGELSEARKAEANAQHNYDMLKQGLTDEIAAAEHEKKEAEDDKAEAAGIQATSEGELVITEKDLADAQAALKETGADCMEKAADHSVSTQGRADELKALATAKKIIQQSSSGAEGQSYSFLQVSATSSLRTETDLRNFEVVNVLKRLAQQQHSTALSQLASRIATTIRYGQASGDDPFAKVKGLIEDMIARLMKEAEAEASHKAYCDEEMSKTKAKKDELNADIEKLTSKIDTASARSAALKEDVKELQKELAELQETQAEMDKIREDTHKAFVEAKADLEEGLEGIRGALSMLRDYYQADASLLQAAGGLDAFMQQPAPPVTKHEKASGAGGGIISMLEVIESDFAKNLAQEEEEEAAAQTAYDKLTQENKVTKTVKEQDVKYKTQEFTSLDKEVAELSGDREGAQTELDAVLEYYEKIKDQCIAKPEPYEERKRRREAEIAGLKEALSILEGQAFLQKRSALRGITSHH